MQCHHTVDIPATTGKKKQYVLKDNERIGGRGALRRKGREERVEFFQIHGNNSNYR